MPEQLLANGGEDEACKHLKAHDYKIICRNYRCRLGEIDIIANKNSNIVFVEVKTRKTLKFGMPAEAVTKANKQKYTQRLCIICRIIISIIKILVLMLLKYWLMIHSVLTIYQNCFYKKLGGE